VCALGSTFIDTADLIALKLLAGRSKDIEDVAGLLRATAPDFAIDVARQRVADLGAMVDDGTLVAMFDRLIGARAQPKARKPSPGAPRPARAPKRKPR
jgi:hypothetical protein